jgi:hypothetical protein
MSFFVISRTAASQLAEVAVSDWVSVGLRDRGAHSALGPGSMIGLFGTNPERNNHELDMGMLLRHFKGVFGMPL